MNPEESYAAWKNLRRQVDVEAGFSDRVMQRIREHEGSQPGGLLPGGHGRRMWQFTAVAALVLVGLAAGLLRAGSVITLVLLDYTGGY